MASENTQDDEIRHIQALFSSKDRRFQVPESSFSLPVSATRNDLNSLVSHLLNGTEAEEGGDGKDFDFLVQGELLQTSLDSHISMRKIPTERVIEIEVIERNPPPTLSMELEHKDWVSAVHCREKLILTGCYDNTIKIWNHSGELQCTAAGHTAPVKDVSWITTAKSPVEYTFLSASQDQTINLWKFMPSSSQVVHVHTCRGHERSVEAIAVSPNHNKFCSVSWDKLLKIWSAVADEQMVDEVEEEQVQVTKRPRNSSLHRATTRTPLLTLQAHTQPVKTVTWPMEETVLSAGMDHCIRSWDIPSGVNKSTLTGSKVFHCIDQSLKSTSVASANSDKVVRIWDTRVGANSMLQLTLTSHQGWVIAVKWSPINEHQLLSGSYDSTLRLWDIRSNKTPMFTIAAHEGKVLCLDWSLPKLLASGGTDNMLRIFTFGHAPSNSG